MSDTATDTTTTATATDKPAATATTTVTDKPATTTIVNDKPATTTATDKPATAAWPDNWRQTYTTDDKKLKQLERYSSPNAALDALFEAQKKISSGEKPTAVPFPREGTDEQKAAWRKDNGIPAKAEEYDLKFDDKSGVDLTEESDKAAVSEFTKAAHEMNMPPDQVKGSVAAWMKIRGKMVDDLLAKDATVRKENEEKLRTEWGSDYQRNLNLIAGLFDQAPAGLRDRFTQVRSSDGIPFGNDIEAVRWLADVARQLNPAIAVVPNAGQNVASAIDDEIKTLETQMKAGRNSPEGKKYWGDETAQARLRELYGARDSLKARGK